MDLTLLATESTMRNNVVVTWLWFHKFIFRNAITLETTEWKQPLETSYQDTEGPRFSKSFLQS